MAVLGDDAGPELAPDLLWVWNAWQDMASERPWIGGGMGGAAVQGETPASAVRAAAERLGLCAEDAAFLLDMVRVLDAERIAIEGSRKP